MPSNTRRPTGRQRFTSALKREGQWTISIRDNGIGFNMEDAVSLFAPFKRLHTAEEYPGTGVGLQFASVSCRRKADEFGPSRSQVKEQLSSSRYRLTPHRR